MEVLIRAKRIRSLERHLAGVPPGSEVVVGVGQPERFGARLQELGFTERLDPGERVLPAIMGPRSKYNAEGDYIVHRDRPKETAYRQVEWHWEEFHGPYDRVPQSRIVDVPYKRYPRTFVPPPAIEISVAQKRDDGKFLVTDAIPYDDAHGPELLHRVNLFLELFEEAETLTRNLENYVVPQIRRLNWRLLPPGEMPWNQVRSELAPHLDRTPRVVRQVVEQRLETIRRYGPTLTAVGQGGFGGYVVFGFPDKQIYVLESIHYGNATYVFGEDWEELSRRTKAEILNGNLEQDRIIHREGWGRRIRDLLA